MKTLLVLCICFAVTLGAPSNSAPALEFSDVRDDSNQYLLKYVTPDGVVVIERGSLVPTADGKDKVLMYDGEYQFKGDDGKIYTTKYKSDPEGGFKIEGNHLPKQVEPLPVPAEVGA